MRLSDFIKWFIQNNFQFQHLKDQTYYNKATKTIQSSIETTIKLIKSREIQFFDDKDILYFVKLSERILEAINVRDESIYDALLSLLDEFDVKNQKIRKLEEMQNLRIRKKREVYNNPRAKMSPGVDVIQTALSLLGKSNPDSSKVIETIEKHSLRYCNNREAKFPYEISKKHTFKFFRLNIKFDKILLFQILELHHSTFRNVHVMKFLEQVFDFHLKIFKIFQQFDSVNCHN